MAKLCKVLFISAPVGDGHIRAAQAVSLALGKYDNTIETKIANIFDFFNPYIGQTILKIYLKILKLFPVMYGMAYSWGNESYLALIGRKIISGYLAKKMEKYIRDYDPAIIVCTHATPAGVVAHLLKNNKLTVPVIAVVTDFVVHRLWIYPEIKHYIVGHKNMCNILMEHGVQANSIQVMGIPVEEKFIIVPDRQEIFTKLALNAEIKTILIMAGGTGLLPMDEIVLACEKVDIPIQLIVVTGNNKSMYQKLLILQPALRNSVRILGYVNNVNELMSISDLIISKPGGMTVAEALCQRVPMLIYKPIPGQEEANTNYLIACQAALRADSLLEIQEIIEKIFNKKNQLLTSLQENTLKIGQPRAASMIAQYIYSQLTMVK